MPWKMARSDRYLIDASPVERFPELSRVRLDADGKFDGYSWCVEDSSSRAARAAAGA